MTDWTSPPALRRLIEDSDGSFPVIEQAVSSLREQLAELEPGDADVVEILRVHLLAINSPSDVLKFFSLELLERFDTERAEAIFVEVIEALARSPIRPERTYPVERAVVKRLGDREVSRALPALAVLAGREVYPLSRTAARAVATIVGSTDTEAITERFKRDDLPEASLPLELSEGVARALFPQKRSSTKSSQARRRQLTYQNVLPTEDSQACLRPEGDGKRQRRLKAIVRSADRDPSRCGNCDQATQTRIGHMVPVSRGGTDLPGNLIILCRECRGKLPRVREAGFEDDGAPRRAEDSSQLTLF